VLADIDPRTFNLDSRQVERFLSAGQRDKLRALFPVHLYGQCADMDSLQRLASEFHREFSARVRDGTAMVTDSSSPSGSPGAV
jgi:dTDP-4-amino-4,6-dideoxygalactose transaminase